MVRRLGDDYSIIYTSTTQQPRNTAAQRRLCQGSSLSTPSDPPFFAVASQRAGRQLPQTWKDVRRELLAFDA